MELGFSSLVHNGTVRFGFSLPRPGELLLNQNDPLYQAVASEVAAIKTVSLSLSELDDQTEVEEEVKQALTDPKLRDSALIAVRELAPSGRSHGIGGVTIAGGGVRAADVRPLTKESRLAVFEVV
jgi:hypothetical protein